MSVQESKPLIKDEYGYVLNPYVPKYLSEKRWYTEEKLEISPSLNIENLESKNPKRNFDEIHDRWNNFDINDHSSTICIDKEKHIESQLNKKTKKDQIGKENLSSLRIREDLVKYLDKESSHVSYNPKSRSLISQDVSHRSEDQLFPWDENQRKNKKQKEIILKINNNYSNNSLDRRSNY
jgi:hypothetical protein